MNHPIRPPSELLTLVHSVINGRLVAVSALVHVFDGNRNETHPIEMKLLFSESVGFVVDCSPDGSVRFRNGDISGVDMREHGALEVMDWNGNSIFRNIVGSTLKDVGLIYSISEQLMWGVRFVFEAEKSFDVLNNGDDLEILSTASDAVLTDDTTVFSAGSFLD